MSIFSTLTLSKDQVLEEIKQRLPNLEKMSMPRLVEVLESMVQYRDYDYKTGIDGINNDEDNLTDPTWEEPFLYNNFWSKE